MGVYYVSEFFMRLRLINDFFMRIGINIWFNGKGYFD